MTAHWILDGQFSAVRHAIGTLRRNEAGAAFLCGVVEEAKASGPFSPS